MRCTQCGWHLSATAGLLILGSLVYFLAEKLIKTGAARPRPKP